jgi:hypothetical protein
MANSVQFKKAVVRTKVAATNKEEQAAEELVTRIDAEELKVAVQDKTTLLDLLHRHKAPAAIFRIKDDEPRKLHANVRAAFEAINAAPDKEALASLLCVASGLSKAATVTDCLLYLLGPYDLRKGPDGTAIDAFFWSRDRGVQSYLERHSIRSADVVAKLADLGGVHRTYTIWCAEKKGVANSSQIPRRTLDKAVREKVPDLRVGERICIEVELNKSRKLEFIGIHRCVPEVDSEIVADKPPQKPSAASDCSVTPVALIEAPIC